MSARVVVWNGLLALLLLFALGALNLAWPGDGDASSDMRLRRTVPTRHEGEQLYTKHWNFWTRADGEVDRRGAEFFRGLDTRDPALRRLLAHIGDRGRPAHTEQEIWRRIGLVWRWCREHVRVDNGAYRTISSDPDDWPSFRDYAKYYEQHGELVWAACFSKAHLFAGLLGCLFYPAERIALAHAHHTEDGAPPTATHVYVAVYVAGRWFYLDPTAVPAVAFPSFEGRRSVGAPSLTKVDYEHPYKVTPLPGSTLVRVPLLPSR